MQLSCQIVSLNYAPINNIIFSFDIFILLINYNECENKCLFSKSNKFLKT